MTSNTKKELSVALLFSDIKKARDISEVLREFKIFAHFYQDLDTFWVDVKNEKPDLAIVDITNMSQDELLLKNHPFIVEKILPLAFYYSEETEALLSSTYNLLHYGYIKEELNLRGQILQILNRREEDIKNLDGRIYLEQRVSRLRKQNAQTIAAVSNIKSSTSNYEWTINSVAKLDEYLTQKDYFSALGQLLDGIRGVRKYSFYELSPKKTKLVTHAVFSLKFLSLPDLATGQEQTEGAESLVQDMAYQVVREVLGPEVKTVKIKGKGINPEILLYLDIDEEASAQISWSLLEMLLSASYLRSNTEKTNPLISSVPTFSAWDFVGKVDDIQRSGAVDKYRIFHISFAQLVGVVKNNEKNKFFWAPSFKEILNEVQKLAGIKSIVCPMGIKSIFIMVEADAAEAKYNNLKNYLEKFPFYRYFEDAAQISTKDLRPSMRLVSPSANNVLRHLEQEFEGLDKAIEIASQRAAQIMSRTQV
ncbi:MAG: hypothetical protein JNM93_12375 [Bacteriovoracaceae bacterium]|nr:hypothetical protein [Bacteriovoracaceae bacterium]